jgi:hypothetical protein
MYYEPVLRRKSRPGRILNRGRCRGYKPVSNLATRQFGARVGDRRSGISQDRGKQIRVGLALEGSLPRADFVEKDAHGEDVRPVIQGPTLR